MPHQSRLIGTLAAMWVWREIRRIGFDQQTVVRNSGSDFPQLIRLLESHHPGKTDIHTPCQALLGRFPTPGKGMHDPNNLAVPVVLFEHFQDIQFAISHVNHQRLSGIKGECNVPGKPVFLDFQWAVIPIPIESRLADGDDLTMLGQLQNL